uniref:Uncharacterized protein n=1 Tax=Megaselia scalaris TaxID=36166 RepID=T1GJB7_MEGSC
MKKISSMAINQLNKQNAENDMNSNNCYGTISESDVAGSGLTMDQPQPQPPQNVYSNILKEFSNKNLNGNDDTTTDGVQFPIQGNNGATWIGGSGNGTGSGFEYVTYHGLVGGFNLGGK